MLNGVQKFERILVPFQLLVQVDQAFDNIHVSSQEDAVLINWGSRRNDYIEEAMLFGCVEMDVAEVLFLNSHLNFIISLVNFINFLFLFF